MGLTWSTGDQTNHWSVCLPELRGCVRTRLDILSRLRLRATCRVNWHEDPEYMYDSVPGRPWVLDNAWDNKSDHVRSYKVQGYHIMRHDLLVGGWLDLLWQGNLFRSTVTNVNERVCPMTEQDCSRTDLVYRLRGTLPSGHVFFLDGLPDASVRDGGERYAPGWKINHHVDKTIEDAYPKGRWRRYHWSLPELLQVMGPIVAADYFSDALCKLPMAKEAFRVWRRQQEHPLDKRFLS